MSDMIDKIKNLDTEVPKWDVALASLAAEASDNLGRGLSIDDIQNLAREHAIRFDDLMATLFELVLQNQWRYESADGHVQTLQAEEVEKLFEAGRLKEPDLRDYTGRWIPQ